MGYINPHYHLCTPHVHSQSISLQTIGSFVHWANLWSRPQHWRMKGACVTADSEQWTALYIVLQIEIKISSNNDNDKNNINNNNNNNNNKCYWANMHCRKSEEGNAIERPGVLRGERRWNCGYFWFMSGRKWIARQGFTFAFYRLTTAVYCSETTKRRVRDRRDFYFRSRYFRFRPGGKPDYEFPR